MYTLSAQVIVQVLFHRLSLCFKGGVGIDPGGADRGVAQEVLDAPQIGSQLQDVGGRTGVAEGGRGMGLRGQGPSVSSSRAGLNWLGSLAPVKKESTAVYTGNAWLSARSSAFWGREPGWGGIL